MATKVVKGKAAKKVFPKTVCPISRKEFINSGVEATLMVGPGPDDQPNIAITAAPRVFSSDSFGWYFSGKATVVVNGKKLKCQVGTNLIVVGSKEMK